MSEENFESRPEVISNKDLWIRTGQEPIVTTIKRRRWKWIQFGHTLTKDERNIARHAMDWNPQGTRKRGRPRRRAQKHTEGPEGDQHDLVRSQKSGSGSSEMESNCGRPMSPMGQRGLDDDGEAR